MEDGSGRPTASLPLASGGWAETQAAYRRRDHPALDWRERLEVPTQRSGERMPGQAVVWCLEDTTELDFTRQPGMAGLGRLSDEAQHGRYGPPTWGVPSAGVALGGMDAWRWARGPKDVPPLKESTRGVEGYDIVADLVAPVPDTRRVYIADREGDRRARMDAAARRGTPADWRVRAKHNRHTVGGDKRWDRLARRQPLDEVEFLWPATAERAARAVRQTLYGEQVSLPA